MENQVITILQQLHSSELRCWLHSDLIPSKTEDEMQDFPIVLHTAGSAVPKTGAVKQ